MIPPSLMNITYYFDLVEIWENVPANPTTGAPANGSTPGVEGQTGDANTEPNGAPACDADGVNDQMALQRLFKGYRLVAVPDFECEAFSGYTRWVENRSDDDADRQRVDERARKAVPTRTAAAPGTTEPSPDEPAAGGDSGC